MNRSKPSTVVGGGEMKRDDFFGREQREERRRIRRAQLPQHDLRSREHRQALPPVRADRISDSDLATAVRDERRQHVQLRPVWHLFHE